MDSETEDFIKQQIADVRDEILEEVDEKIDESALCDTDDVREMISDAFQDASITVHDVSATVDLDR